MNDTIENIFLECRGVRVRYECGASRFGNSFYATQRGYFPISPTGYRSCPPIDPNETKGMQLLVSLMNERAKHSDRECAACMRSCQRTLSAKPEADAWAQFVKLDLTVSNAFQLGIFARDEERQTLWPLAYLLFQKLLDGPARHLHHCTSFRERFPDCDIDGTIIKRTQAAFDALKKFMRGEVPTCADFCEQFGPMGLRTYNGLPPRPDGEPRIAAPTTTLELGLNILAAYKADDEEPNEDNADEAVDFMHEIALDETDITEESDDENINDNESVRPAPEQMNLF